MENRTASSEYKLLLQRITARLAAKLGIVLPSIHLITNPESPGFYDAKAGNGHLVFGAGFLEMLRDKEHTFQFLVAHELVHIWRGHITQLSAIQKAMLCLLFGMSASCVVLAFFHVVWLIVLLPLLALFQMGVVIGTAYLVAYLSRRNEYEADHEAALITSAESGIALFRSLLAAEANGVRWPQSEPCRGLDTHPSLGERIERLSKLTKQLP